MPDLSDVEQAIAAVCAAALYPAGTGASSAIGAPCRVHRGWPSADRLDADLKAGVVTVTVYPMPGATRNTTRYLSAWHYAPPVPVPLALSVQGRAVTVAGTPGPALIAAVAVGEVAYHRRCLTGDTPTAVAAGLAALIPGASAAGLVLTLPGDAPIKANAVADWHARRELRRQEQALQVIVWAPTPDLRDLAAGRVDLALTAADRLAMPDGTVARLRYQRTMSTDEGTEALLYRRDLVFLVEYPTVAEAIVPPVASVTRTTAAPPDGPVLHTSVTVTPEAHA